MFTGANERLSVILLAAGLAFVQPGSAGESARTLEEVVVTAERRAESVQDLSGVVQAFDQDELDRLGIVELRQVQLAVPGLSIANQEGNVEIYIRGVGSANNTELGDPAAAPHLNGVYIPRPRGLGGMFYDLDRVEVNKGPQGTLYGRNALAGTLNLITARPRFDEVGGYAQLEYGSRDSYGAEAAVNLPLGERQALRLAGFYLDRDYDFENAGSADLDPAGLQEDRGVRLSYLTEPTERLSMLLIADYGEEAGTGYPGANIFSAVTGSGRAAEDLDLREVVYRGTEGDMENEIWGLQAHVAYDFDAVTLQYLGSYRDMDFAQRNAASDGIAFPGRDLEAVDYDVFSSQYWEQTSESQVHELRLVSASDAPVVWSVGAFYFDEDQQAGFFSLADKGYCCYSGTEFVMPDVQGEAWAVYGDATYPLSDRTRVFGGLRYTDEQKSRFGIGGNWALTLGGEDFACCVATRLGTDGFVPAMLERPNFDVSDLTDPQGRAQFLIEGIATPGANDTLIQQIGPIADGTNPQGDCFVRPDIDNGFVTCADGSNPDTAYANGGFTYADITIPGQQVGASDFDYVDWRIGVEHDLSDDNMIYAKISSGHKAGGFNDSFDDGVVAETFEPEDVLVYEVGSRNLLELGGRPATLNATGFYYDYDDQVFQDLLCINLDVATGECNGYSLVNRNIGTSRIYGLELESNLSLGAGFALDLNAVWLSSKITGGVVADARAQDFGQGGISPLIDLSGNRLPLQSDFSAALRLSQRLEVGAGAVEWQALVSHRSSYYLTQFNEDDVVYVNGTRQSALEAGFPDEQEAVTTINLGAAYAFPGDVVRIEGFINNLTDEEASQKAIVGANLNLRFLNDARTYGVRLVTRF